MMSEIETIGGIEKQREKTGTADLQTYYLHRDYLGSITQISNNNGNLAAEYSYDAWGRMRNPSNWQVYSQGTQPAMLYGGRGYTGHEHLNQFGLVNMNARLYDPLLARFLAPDPFVGSGMTNDFNRYIYCLNNPLMFTDPSGKSWKSFWRDFGNAFVRDFKRTFCGVNGFELRVNSGGGFSLSATRGGTSFGPSIGGNWKQTHVDYNQIVSQSAYEGVNSLYSSIGGVDASNSDHDINLLAKDLNHFTDAQNGLDITFGKMLDDRSWGGAQLSISYTGNVKLSQARWQQTVTTDWPLLDGKFSREFSFTSRQIGRMTTYPDNSLSSPNSLDYYSQSEMNSRIIGGYTVNFTDTPRRPLYNRASTYWYANLTLINNDLPLFTINYGFRLDFSIIHLIYFNYYFYPQY